MEREETVFTDFVVRKKGSVLSVKARPGGSMLENLGFFGMFWLGIFAVYEVINIYIINFRLSEQVSFIFSIISVLLALFLMRSSVVYILGVTILVVDKEYNLLSSPLEQFKTELTNIKDVSIIEEISQVGEKEIMQYRLKFTLQDGEKTAFFAFTSYNKLEAIANLIRENMK